MFPSQGAKHAFYCTLFLIIVLSEQKKHVGITENGRVTSVKLEYRTKRDRESNKEFISCGLVTSLPTDKTAARRGKGIFAFTRGN